MIGGITLGPGMASKASAARPTKAARKTKSAKAEPTNAAELAQQSLAQGHVPLPPPLWMEQELPRLLQKYGAFGFHIGMKQRRGRWSRQPVMVFLTEHKGSPRQRGAGTATIPKFLSWKDGKHRHRLPTDVVQAEPRIELQMAAVFGPGDAADVSHDVASIGAAVRRPGSGDFLTTAGHLVGAQGAGRSVQMSSDGLQISARVFEAVVANEIDYALLRPPLGIFCDNLFQDRVRIGPVYTPIVSDVGASLFVLGRNGVVVPAVCRGVNQLLFTVGGSYRGVIATNPVTSGGQSGGALIDSSNRLWGFLLGVMPGRFSLFVPAQSIFDAAGVFLIK